MKEMGSGKKKGKGKASCKRGRPPPAKLALAVASMAKANPLLVFALLSPEPKGRIEAAERFLACVRAATRKT
jgi:hypothetical protein